MLHYNIGWRSSRCGVAFHMKWFRSNIKDGARLALLSLFLQLALSFGHFHALAAPSNHVTTSALPAGAAVDSGDLAVQSQIKQKQTLNSNQIPAKQDSDQHGP